MINIIESWAIFTIKQKSIHILYIKLGPSVFFKTEDPENTVIHQ